MIDSAILKQAINKISSIEEFQMDPKHLALDILALSMTFNDETKFGDVVNSVIDAIHSLLNDVSIGEDLEHNLVEWKSYHFSSPYTTYPGEEDMRMVYQSVTNIKILAFGHRYTPTDFYKRFINRI
ncbi:hypothetical protein [Sporosarcina limicola]|uniref:Uncharacterized protein n=1 Tax=Sporosarcina limicola TaxID=34101 RepID=A0A927MN90_9BACL|nr:hypothetical protein [Sporosarcina limicola]MBE1556237.1 hypothetical protein [Sporosarcina limicola]